MKNLILSTCLLASVSCAPYYVGRKPLAPEPGLAVSEQVAPSERAVPKVEATVVALPNPPAAKQEEPVRPTVPTGLSADDWGDEQAVVNVENANMPSKAPAYGWDGQPVDENSRKLHQLEGSEETRGVMIDMYTEEIAKNEELQKSLFLERDTVDRLLADILTLKAVASVDAQEIAALKLDLAEKVQEKDDLEARLVTAQIRRLQAEKLLLEDRLKVAEEATPAASRMGSGSFANAGGR
jgi:hypothetical protein